MQIAQTPTDSQNYIQAYSEQQIQINDQLFQHSLIVTPTILISDWPPQTFAELRTEHWQPLINLTPEIILLGTGNELHLLHPDWQILLHAKHIGVETMNTGAACRTYNLLVSEGRKVVAALLLK